MSKRLHTEKAHKANYILRMARILYAIEYLGRYCSVCQADGFETPWSMNFHHQNEYEKLYEVKNKLYGSNLNIHKSEIDKCTLVCANCHSTLHATNDKYHHLKPEILNKLTEMKNHHDGTLVSGPLSENRKLEIIKLVKDGYNMKEISINTGINYERVKYVVKCHKLNPHKGIRIPTSIILKYLNQKHSIRSIAEKININRETVRKWVLENISFDIVNNVKIFRYNDNYSSLAIQAKT